MKQDKSINEVAYTIAYAAIFVIGNLIVIMLFDNAIPYNLIPVVLVILFASLVAWRRRRTGIQVDERIEANTDKSARNALLAAIVIFYAISFEVDSESAKLVLGGITAAILVFAISLFIYNKRADLSGGGK